MKMTSVPVELQLLFAKCIIANEIGNDVSLAYRFSDPDGERTGKSGWSFGICQFDIFNNQNATKILKECGFSNTEIQGLKDQTVDVASLNHKLIDGYEVINKWDAKQLKECLVRALTNCMGIGIDFSSEEVLLHLADYDNQFYFAPKGKLYKFLLDEEQISPELFLQWKRTSTEWGIKQTALHGEDANKNDVLMRYNNIAKIYAHRA
jgi:hypothetical protein